MAPPRARMTNDRSTGVAVKVKLAGIGTGRRLLGNKPLDAAYNAFFLSDGCMAQRGRCPGSRPSVSANKRIRCILFCSKVATVQAIYEYRIRSAVSQRVPLSVLASPIASSN